MAYKIIIKEEARFDTETAYNYYENEREGLGEEFLQELVKTYEKLTNNPNYYSYIDDQNIIRDLKVERFPYVIIYEIVNDNVVIYAIHNTYRHPRRRLKK